MAQRTTSDTSTKLRRLIEVPIFGHAIVEQRPIHFGKPEQFHRAVGHEPPVRYRKKTTLLRRRDVAVQRPDDFLVAEKG
jgi:hypothetical protein